VRKPPPGALIQPRELPPQLKAPDPNEPREELEFGDGTDGVVGGVVGGALEAPAALAPAPPPPPPRPVKYDTRMTAPVLVSAPPLEYTQQALEREVEGTMLVECVVEVDGSVRACKVLRSLPFMDRAVISNLEQRRYRPATLGGQPLAVQYTFAVKFKLPE
jgi:protein TonB